MAEEIRYLSFMGMRVHYSVARPEGEVNSRVLLLTSPLMSIFNYRKLLPELNALGCLAVVVDLPGFGLSDRGAPQAHSMRANILWGLLDAVDEETEAPMSTWHLLAHGSACPTVMEMAAMYPESVRSQILISPLAVVRSPEHPQKWYDDTLLDERRFIRYIEGLAGCPLDTSVLNHMREPLTQPGSRETFMRMFRAMRRPPEHDIGFCPTFAIWGGADPLLDASALETTKQYIKEAECHVLKTAGHFPTETHYKALCDYLRGWIRYVEG